MCYNRLRIKEPIMRKTAFIGHRRIFADSLPERLMSAISGIAVLWQFRLSFVQLHIYIAYGEIIDFPAL